jgi:hypothetical protein
MWKLGVSTSSICPPVHLYAWNNSRTGFEVLTAVVMKSTIFWDITPCSPLKVNRRLGGTYRLHLQGRKISRARNQRESRWQAEVNFQRTTRRYIAEDGTLQLENCWTNFHESLFWEVLMKCVDMFQYGLKSHNANRCFTWTRACVSGRISIVTRHIFIRFVDILNWSYAEKWNTCFMFSTSVP